MLRMSPQLDNWQRCTNSSLNESFPARKDRGVVSGSVAAVRAGTAADVVAVCRGKIDPSYPTTDVADLASELLSLKCNTCFVADHGPAPAWQPGTLLLVTRVVNHCAYSF